LSLDGEAARGRGAEMVRISRATLIEA